MPFPSTLSALTDPQASDRLNSPSHSAIEQAQNTGIEQVEAVIGVEGAASVVGSFQYLIKSPASDGGGHIQVANKGGTGQTSYTKGDLLVATSSSVLAKLAVSSTTGEILTIDPLQSAGVKWAAAFVGTKVAISNSVVVLTGGMGSVSNVLFAASVTGSLLGAAGGVKFRGVIQQFAVQEGQPINIAVNYGATTISSIVMLSAASIKSTSGIIEGTIIANNSSVAQLGYAQWLTKFSEGGGQGAGQGNQMTTYGFGYGTAAINSSGNQDLIIRASIGSSTNFNSILTGFFTVEKIV